MLRRLVIKKPDKYIERAHLAMDRGDWPTAVKNWQVVAKLLGDKTPDNILVKLSACYQKLEQYKEAQKIIDRGLKIHPRSMALHTESAQIAMDSKQWATAVKRWKNIESVFGQQMSLGAQVRLVRSLRSSREFEAAQTAAQKYLKQHPKNTELEIELAEAVTATKDWPNALKYWDVVLAGLDNSSEGMKLYTRLNISFLKRLVDIKHYKNLLQVYSKHLKTGPRNKIAIVTSVTKGYDGLQPHEFIDDRFDYIVYTDANFSNMGLYDIRPLPQPDLDGPRSIRYVKTHPHSLLSQYDLVVWLDTSIMITGDIYPILQGFLKSGKSIGASVHPLRKSVYEEFEACIAAKKDGYEIMKSQMDYYKRAGFAGNNLAECGFLAFNLKDHADQVALAMETWWEQLSRFSARDQLSFTYSLEQHNLSWYALTKPPTGVRNNPSFILTPHHTNQPLLDELMEKIT